MGRGQLRFIRRGPDSGHRRAGSLFVRGVLVIHDDMFYCSGVVPASATFVVIADETTKKHAS